MADSRANLGKTKGHGNPHWTRDETILALDIYLRHYPKVLGKTHRDVVELSSLLQRLPFHAGDKKKQRFRSPASVAFKLLNLDAARTGKGLTNISQLDRKLWAQLGADPERVRLFAAAIRTASDSMVIEDGIEEDEEAFEVEEGRILGRIHRTRERARGLRKEALKRTTKRLGRLQCEGCDFVPDQHLSEAADSFFEVHHLLPLHQSGERKTRLSDVALLCANCHRLIHRMNALRDAWWNLTDLRVLLGR